jgi:hypothetical protein
MSKLPEDITELLISMVKKSLSSVVTSALSSAIVDVNAVIADTRQKVESIHQ